MEYQVTNSTNKDIKILTTEEILKIYKHKMWNGLTKKIKNGYEHLSIEIAPIGHIIYFDKF